VIPIERTARVRRRLPTCSAARFLADRRNRRGGPEDRRSLLARVATRQRETRRPCARSSFGDQPDDDGRGDGRFTSPTSCAGAPRGSRSRGWQAGLPVGSDLEYADEVTLGKGVRRSPLALIANILRQMSGVIVMKFGGTSVADARADQARSAADRRQSASRGGGAVVAVAVGARQDDRRADRDGRGGVRRAPIRARWDMLPVDRRADLVARCGAMAINDLGHRADLVDRLAGGDRDPTSRTRRRGSSTSVPDRIKAAASMDDPHRPPWAGFQGVVGARRANVTTLGAAGARTRRAVAVAAALHADVCEIYTDVSGRLQRPTRESCPTRRKLGRWSRSRRCSRWAGVRRRRACSCAPVEYGAQTTGVRIHCRSSFDEEPGTVVVAEAETMEQPPDHSGDALDVPKARLTLLGRGPDELGAAARIFAAAGPTRTSTST